MEPTFPSLRGWTRLCLRSAGLPSLLPLPLAITADDPQGHEMSAIAQMSIQKLFRQLWPNTKKGRWQCLCLRNAGPWSCRPRWMRTHLQIPLLVQKMKARYKEIPRVPPPPAKAASTWSTGSAKPSTAPPRLPPLLLPPRAGAVGLPTG